MSRLYRVHPRYKLLVAMGWTATAASAAVCIYSKKPAAQITAATTLMGIGYGTIMNYINNVQEGKDHTAMFTDDKKPISEYEGSVTGALVVGPMYSWMVAFPAGLVLAAACTGGNKSTTLPASFGIKSCAILLPCVLIVGEMVMPGLKKRIRRQPETYTPAQSCEMVVSNRRHAAYIGSIYFGGLLLLFIGMRRNWF